MEGFRFYLDYPNNREKRKGTRSNPGTHCGTVLAVYTDRKYCWSAGNDVMNEAIGAVMDKPNSDVCNTACSWGYLREKCKRISEKLARTIHPKLFESLDYEP